MTTMDNIRKKFCKYFCPHCGYPIKGKPDEDKYDIENTEIIVKWFGRKCQKCKKLLNICIKEKYAGIK
jgi:hypothetical protein